MSALHHEIHGRGARPRAAARLEPEPAGLGCNSRASWHGAFASSPSTCPATAGATGTRRPARPPRRPGACTRRSRRSPSAMRSWAGRSAGSSPSIWRRRCPAGIERLALVSTTPRFLAAPGWPFGTAPVLLARLAEQLRCGDPQAIDEFCKLQVRGNTPRTAARVLKALRAALKRGTAQPAALLHGLERLRNADLRPRCRWCACRPWSSPVRTTASCARPPRAPWRRSPMRATWSSPAPRTRRSCRTRSASRKLWAASCVAELARAVPARPHGGAQRLRPRQRALRERREPAGAHRTGAAVAPRDLPLRAAGGARSRRGHRARERTAQAPLSARPGHRTRPLPRAC